MIKDYIAEKCKILKDLGINNSLLLEATFRRKIKGMTDEGKMEIRIDQLSRDIIRNYFEGDRTYLVRNSSVQKTYETLKAKYTDEETLYEDTIVSLLGIHGLTMLKKNQLIELCATLDGRNLYAV